MSREIRKIIDKWFKENNQKDKQGWRSAIGREEVNELIKRIEEWLDNN
jgi:hypothetical protein